MRSQNSEFRSQKLGVTGDKYLWQGTNTGVDRMAVDEPFRDWKAAITFCAPELLTSVS